MKTHRALNGFLTLALALVCTGCAGDAEPDPALQQEGGEVTEDSPYDPQNATIRKDG